MTSTGTVYSCTTIHRGFPGFDTPFTVAWVDLPSGERALATAKDRLDELLRPGDVVVVEHDDDRDVLTFRKDDM
jgi:uncharacterized OB-fold protein